MKSETIPLMRIAGKSYREVPENGYGCDHCAFYKPSNRCQQALEKSSKIFGGDCVDRIVIYEEVNDA